MKVKLNGNGNGRRNQEKRVPTDYNIYVREQMLEGAYASTTNPMKRLSQIARDWNNGKPKHK